MPIILFTASLLIGRVIYTGSPMFLFIAWNLFLAIAPLYFSHKLVNTADKRKAWLLLGAWLLFFPNAMYIVTDLFHLQDDSEIPMWFDLLILFSAALTGVIIGFLSLQNVEKYLGEKLPGKYMKWALASLFFLCGYGIYLGRYLRWNSWDIVVQPIPLFSDIRQDVFHPFRNFECWLLSVLFGTWLYILYKYFIKFKPLVPGVAKEMI
jgi:uncharacterized membrane protein